MNTKVVMITALMMTLIRLTMVAAATTTVEVLAAHTPMKRCSFARKRRSELKT